MTRINWNEFWIVWVKIIEENKNGAVIVVEGQRDLEALRKLWIKGKVVLSRRYDFYTTIELIRSKGNRVIILTDFDEEGEHEARKLKRELNRIGIKVLDRLRRNLKNAFRDMKRIEDLSPYIDHLLAKAPLSLYIKHNLQLVKINSP